MKDKKEKQKIINFSLKFNLQKRVMTHMINDMKKNSENLKEKKIKKVFMSRCLKSKWSWYLLNLQHYLRA